MKNKKPKKKIKNKKPKKNVMKNAKYMYDLLTVGLELTT